MFCQVKISDICKQIVFLLFCTSNLSAGQSYDSLIIKASDHTGILKVENIVKELKFLVYLPVNNH